MDKPVGPVSDYSPEEEVVVLARIGAVGAEEVCLIPASEPQPLQPTETPVGP